MGPTLFLAMQIHIRVPWAPLFTHNPSASIFSHVTEDLQRLCSVSIQINSVEPRGDLSIQESLGAVFRIRIKKTSYTKKENRKQSLRDQQL